MLTIRSIALVMLVFLVADVWAHGGGGGGGGGRRRGNSGCNDDFTECEWKRIVNPFTAPVPENVEVNNDAQTITMHADDEALEGTPYVASVSFHDFDPETQLEAGSKGILAIKALDRCFVTNVAKSFDDTMEAIKRRSRRPFPTVLASPPEQYTVAREEMTNLADFSAAAADFCDGLTTHRLEPTAFPGTPAGSFLFPFWILCIFWPYPIWFLDGAFTA